MEKTVKTITPETYKLQDGTMILGEHDKLKCSIVYREKNGFKYFDILVDLNGRLFVVKPCSFYSQKSVNVYRWELKDLAIDKLSQII